MATAPTRARMRDIFLGSRSSARLAAAATAAQTAARFSLFDPEDSARALTLANDLMRTADRARGDSGLTAVLDEVERRIPGDGEELVLHALKVFAVHHPEGRQLMDSIPRLADRQLSAAAASVSYRGKTDPADGLEWYREDPFANEHHEHWHVVYPTNGLIDRRDGRPKTKDRQGELFFHMHRQMLARYDAERAALEQPRVQPFDDYRQAIDQGYDPGPAFAADFSARARGLVLPGIATPLRRYTVSDHELRRQRFQRIVETGQFEASTDPVTVDRLGATAEPTINSVTRGADSFYGNWHGFGHLLIASVNGPDDEAGGVMQDTATAIRDPIFYRWHKHIDNIYERWQDRGPVQDLARGPYVRMRKTYANRVAASPDIAFCPISALGGQSAAEFGNGHLGGSNWDAAASGKPFTDEFVTRMHSTVLELPGGGSADVTYLTHEEFAYFLRVENRLPMHYTVSARVFLAPLAERPGTMGQYWADTDRTVWIEMDKFLFELAPREKKVVARLGSESSVIRKPGEMRPNLLLESGLTLTADGIEVLRSKGVPESVLTKLGAIVGQRFPNANALRTRLTGDSIPAALHDVIAQEAFLGSGPVRDDFDQDRLNYCTCGWPYNLLLPRGTPEGMAFRFFVILTDWEEDRVGPDSCCGSVSYCGARDSYPDRRPMGYPFDQRFPFSIPDTAMAYDNVAMRDIVIRFDRGAE